MDEDTLQKGGLLPAGSPGLIRVDHGCRFPFSFDSKQDIGEIHFVTPSKEEINKFTKRVTTLCEEYRNA